MKNLVINITGPAQDEHDPEFASQLLAAVAAEAESDTCGVVHAMDMDGITAPYTWSVSVEDRIPNDLALLREARDYAQFADLPKVIKDALFRVIDENDGMWPCEPSSEPDAPAPAAPGDQFRITIAGRHGSGKSALAQLIGHSLRDAGVRSITVLNEDTTPEHLASTYRQRLARVVAGNPQITLDMVQLRRDGTS